MGIVTVPKSNKPQSPSARGELTSDGTATQNDGGTDDNASATAREAVTNVESLVGSNNADTLTGAATGVTIAGGGGNDTITGGAANDNLQGGEGDDTLDGAGGQDDMSGGNGSDTVSYATRSVRVGQRSRAIWSPSGIFSGALRSRRWLTPAA